MNDNAQSKIVIKPHLLPRSLSDFLITFLILLLQLDGLFVVPALVIFLVFYSCMLAFLVPLAVYFVFLALSVWSITLSKDGIHFRRLLGSPKMLPWSDVVSIEVAPRWELIRKGWLWPLIPAREMTASLSSLGHYRITWLTVSVITHHWTLRSLKTMFQNFSQIVFRPNMALNRSAVIMRFYFFSFPCRARLALR
jgi:hypothetical protein